MSNKAKVQARHVGAFAKQDVTGRWLVMRPVGTGSYAHIGQGDTPAKAWQDAADDIR